MFQNIIIKWGESRELICFYYLSEHQKTIDIVFFLFFFFFFKRNCSTLIGLNSLNFQAKFVNHSQKQKTKTKTFFCTKVKPRKDNNSASAIAHGTKKHYVLHKKKHVYQKINQLLPFYLHKSTFIPDNKSMNNLTK